MANGRLGAGLQPLIMSSRQVVLTSSALNVGRGMLVAWPAVLAVGVVIALVVGSVIPALVAIVIFAALGTLAWPRVTQQWLWGRPTLRLTTATPGLGERVGFVYERDSRRVVDVPDGELSLVLVCEEEIEWTEGSGDNARTKTDSQQVARIEVRCAVEPTTTGLRAEGSVVIPTNDGGPSLDLPHHRVEWWIESHLVGGSLPNANESFRDFGVAAVLVAASPIHDTVERGV